VGSAIGEIEELEKKVSVGRAVSLMVIGFFLCNLAMLILLSGSNGTYIGAEGDSFSEAVAEMFVPSMYACISFSC